MHELIEYTLNDNIYIDLKQILPLRPYAVGQNNIINPSK